MVANSSPITYTETEIRSYLPSGWGLVAGSLGRWDAKDASWSIDVCDGAENSWKVTVDSTEVEKRGRLVALDDRIRQLELKALGRKSVISG